MMTPAQIRAEFDRFIEFQPGSDRGHVTTTSTLLFAEHIAALATQAEREARLAAQAENEQLKARLARSGVELRKAVRDEREACQLIADDLTGMLFCHGDKSGSEIAMSIRDNIRARNHIADTSNHVVDANKKAEEPTDWSAS